MVDKCDWELVGRMVGGGGIAWMAMDWGVFFFVFRCIDLLCFTFLKSCPGACLLACSISFLVRDRHFFFFGLCSQSHMWV